MFLSALHGLGMRRSAPAQTNYNTLVSDALLAPLGKSRGSYTLDVNSFKALEPTINLPDVSGYLKQTQVDWLLERNTTPNGDFITARAEPLFPANLGTPIINEAYLDGLMGRQYITMQRNGVWTPWHELYSTTINQGEFIFDTTDPALVTIDPLTLRSYDIEVSASPSLELTFSNLAHLQKTIFVTCLNTQALPIDFTFDSGVEWYRALPATMSAKQILKMEITRIGDNVVATYNDYAI